MDSFNDAVRQAKKAYHDLDFSQLNIDGQAQAIAQPITSESMEDLFADDAALGNGELAPVESQAQPVKGNARQPENVVQENNENTPPHQYFFFYGIVTI